MTYVEKRPRELAEFVRQNPEVVGNYARIPEGKNTVYRFPDSEKANSIELYGRRNRLPDGRPLDILVLDVKGKDPYNRIGIFVDASIASGFHIRAEHCTKTGYKILEVGIPNFTVHFDLNGKLKKAPDDIGIIKSDDMSEQEVMRIGQKYEQLFEQVLDVLKGKRQNIDVDKSFFYI